MQISKETSGGEFSTNYVGPVWGEIQILMLASYFNASGIV